MANNRQPPPCFRFINRITSSSEMKGSKSLLFLRKSFVVTNNKKNSTCLIIGGVSGVIRMWSIPNTGRSNKQQQPTCLWVCQVFSSSSSYLSAEAVSIMKFLKPTSINHTGLLLIGGSRGSFVMVDIAKQSRKLFTNSISPTVLRRWNLSSIVNRQYPNVLLSDNMYGIRNICIWQQPITTKQKSQISGATSDEAFLDLLQQSFISIVISNGWVLNLKFSDSCRYLVDVDISMDAMFVTPTIQQNPKDEHSLESQVAPDIPSHASGMTDSYLLCVTKTLHVDQSYLFLVNVKQNNFKFDGEDNDKHCKQMQSMNAIAVSKNVSAVIVHPCDEWIVTAGGNGEELELISLRHKMEEHD